MEYEIVRADTLTEYDVDQLYAVVLRSFEEYPKDDFVRDLCTKDLVIVYSVYGQIVGFSLQTLLARSSNQYVLHNGLTVVDQQFWGDEAFRHSYTELFQNMVVASQEAELFFVFFALSYKSYGFMKILFNHFYPSWKGGEHDHNLKEIGLWAAHKVCDHSWQIEDGVVKPRTHAKCLKEHIAQKVYEKQSHSDVRFFLQNNSNFFRGDRMICSARLEHKNLTRIAKSAISNRSINVSLLYHLKSIIEDRARLLNDAAHG